MCGLSRRAVLRSAVVLTGSGLAACSKSSDAGGSAVTSRAGAHAAPVSSKSAVDVAELLTRDIEAVNRKAPGRLSISLFDNRSKETWHLRPDLTNETASIVKVLIVATACVRAEAAGRPLTAGEKSLADAAIRYSDNDATGRLWDSVGGTTSVQAVARKIGMTQTMAGPEGYWGLTTTRADDQVQLLKELCWGGKVLSAEHRTYLRGLMGNVAPEHRWGVGKYGKAELKNGWLPYNGKWLINSIGHVTGGGRDYALAILSTAPTMNAGTKQADAIAKIVYDRMADKL